MPFSTAYQNVYAIVAGISFIILLYLWNWAEKKFKVWKDYSKKPEK